MCVVCFYSFIARSLQTFKWFMLKGNTLQCENLLIEKKQFELQPLLLFSSHVCFNIVLGYYIAK